MAESKNNVLTHGLSGMVGDMIVFRQRGGKTFVANAPKDSDKPATQKQEVIRHRFQQSVIYGKTAIADTATKEAYTAQAKPGQTAFNVAVADFFNAPDIDEVNLAAYHGKKGDTIRVRVTDDFMVKNVRVKIENADSSLVEEGDAKMDSNGLDFVYTATADNKDLSGDKITITAFDMPENTSVKETVL